MEIAEVELLIEKLSWNKSETENKEALNRLLLIDDNNIPMLYLLDSGRKDLWHNSALLLQKIGYPRITPILPQLITWLQDLNWPGALIIVDLLSTTEKTVLISEIEKALTSAINDGDKEWIGGIKCLTNNIEIKAQDFSKPFIFEELVKSDFC